jgi:hypothetical protein
MPGPWRHEGEDGADVVASPGWTTRLTEEVTMSTTHPAEKSKPEKPGGNGSTLEVTVFSPRHPDPVPFGFPNGMKVGEAAQSVAEKFGYAPGTPTFKNADGETLDRDKPLRAEHVRAGDVLELVDVGGGV